MNPSFCIVFLGLVFIFQLRKNSLHYDEEAEKYSGNNVGPCGVEFAVCLDKRGNSAVYQNTDE